MQLPIIHAVLIDDDKDDIDQFKELANLSDNVRLQTLHAKKSEGEEPFPEVMAYFANPPNPINLVFCDIRLDTSRESDMVGVELIHRLTQHFGRLPFGIAFVTGVSSVFAANMLVEMVSPTTLCGFAVKWQMPQPSRSFPDMIALILQNFQHKFIYRLNGGDGLADYDVAENYTWFFKGYLDDYLNRPFRVDTLAGQPFRLPLHQIVAFESRPANVVMYYTTKLDKKEQLNSVDIYYNFEDLCTSLADLDFRPSNANDLEQGERRSRTFEPRTDQPIVFARVASKYLVNLQHRTWEQRPAVHREGEVKYANGTGTWLQTNALLPDRQPFQVRTRADCPWGRNFLREWLAGLAV